LARSALGIVSLAREGEADLALAERLFENLRYLILEGLWRYGEKLPGTRIIAGDAGVSRWTAVVAVDMLIAEGLVEARKRSGTYVAWQGAERSESEPAPTTEIVKPRVPFALSVPALDLFPMHVWRRLQARRWQQMPSAALEDGEFAGWPPLRKAIAEYAATVRLIQCSPEQVFVIPSVEAAGRLVAQVLCKPGGLAWIEEPGPSNARAVTASALLVPVSVAVDREGLNVEDGRRLAPTAALAVVTPTVQFPTGVRLSDMRRRKLLEWSITAQSWIFEVDHAGEFPFGGRGARPLASMANAERVIYFDTFGKMLFPSLRVAFIIVPRDTVRRFESALADYDRPPGLPNQIVLADFLASGQFAKHLRRCREAYAQRRATLLEAIEQEFDTIPSIDRQQQGLFICARLPGWMDDTAIVELARAQGVVVEALSSFYEHPTDDRGILLGYAGFRPEQLRDGVRGMAKALESCTRKLAAAS